MLMVGTITTITKTAPAAISTRQPVGIIEA